MNNLNGILRDALIKKGANLVGFADLLEIEESYRESMRYGISVAVAMSPRIIDGISNGPTIDYYNEYKKVNDLLDNIVEYASDLLKNYGFKATPKIKKDVKVHDSTRSSILPHKTVATRAGLGWIGKSALLVTPEYGSAVRISSVLTDAELDVGIPINESKCGDCIICQKMCPGQAITGLNWNINLERDRFYNPHACRKMARERSEKIGIEESLCGLCIFECPWTRKYLNS